MRVPSIARIFEIPARNVAEIGYRGLMRGKRVAVAGLGNKILVALLHLIPNAVLLATIQNRR
jgi:short-subunit dehydrogenase